METVHRHWVVWRADHLFNILCGSLLVTADGKLFIGAHICIGSRRGITAYDSGGILSDNVTHMNVTAQFNARFWNSAGIIILIHIEHRNLGLTMIE